MIGAILRETERGVGDGLRAGPTPNASASKVTPLAESKLGAPTAGRTTLRNDQPSALLREHDFRGDQPWRTLLGLFWPERGQLLVSTVFWLFKASPVWLLPIITANVIDILTAPGRHSLRALWWNAFWGSLCILQNVPTHIWHNNALSLAVRHAETRLRSALCRHLQELSISYYKHTSTGLLQNKVMRDVENIGLATRELYNNGLYSVCTVIITLAVTAVRAPWFVPIFLLATPLVVVLRSVLVQRLGTVNHQFRREFEGLAARLLGMLNMIPVTRAHAVEDDELAQVENRLGQVQSAGLRLDMQNGVVNTASWVTLTEFSLLGLIFSAWVCYRKILPLTAGDVILMSGYFTTLTSVLVGFLNMLPTISRGFESVRSLGEVLECPDLEENHGKRRLHAVRGAFDFQDVRFVYPGRAGDGPDAEESHAAHGDAALTDFTLRVEPGETLGIVGASGSGKSTLMGLLLGFHRPTGGRILLDGEDMNEIDLRTYRRQLAVVSQETILFEGTVRENVLYGVRQVDDGRLRAALTDANAAEFIAALPRGLDTPLGEHGARLSGGQRQRIAIARALIRAPRVLILDEATSALDAQAEAVVQDALDRLMVGRTTFVAAHRLSTLRRANRIAVLHAGRLVELGSAEQLLRDPHGSFARLYSLQSLPAAAALSASA
jgi:ATP-binding cassette subfamily B protein